MGDRLKRRKKSGEAAKDQAKTNAPEPLQPKYFESEISGKPAAGGMETSAASSEEVAPAQETGGRSAPPRSSGQRRSEEEGRGEKETQADFLLASRGVPELPLAAAVSGEGRSRNQNQSQNQAGPGRRRRKRGGRGGRRGAGGGPAMATPVVPAVNFEEPLTPESAGDEAAIVVAAPSPAAMAAEPSSPEPASEAGRAPSAAATAARPSKGTVVLAIGLPGSGKSSWFKRHNIHPLSSDLLRELLFDDAQEQRFQDLVFSNLRSMLKARLIARRPMNYVDATNLTPHDRHSWIKLAKDYGYDVQGLFFDVPLEVCLERHARRGRMVPEDIMRKMAGKLKPPTFEEGFSKITVVRVKQKDAAAG